MSHILYLLPFLLACSLLTNNHSASGVILYTYTTNQCRSLLPQCVCDTGLEIECKHFNSTLELQLNRRKPHKQELVSLSLTASDRRQAILDSDLDVSSLNMDMDKFELKLNNFNGIELNENPFHAETVKNLKRFSYFHMNNSTLQFFYRKRHFDYICDLVLMDSSLTPVFASFSYLFLGNSKANIYPERVCQAVFKNARINWLHLSNLTPDNRLCFHSLDANKTDLDTHLNAKITYFQVQASQIDCLDSSLLDKHVFKYMERFSIEFSNVTRIDQEAFATFKYLKRIHLWLFNFEELIQGKTNTIKMLVFYRIFNLILFFVVIKGDNSWMKSLNRHVTKSGLEEGGSGQQMIIEFNDEANTYTYPEKDFCNFVHFPHENNVYPLINTKQNLTCTCTLLWLIQKHNDSEKVLETKAIKDCWRSRDLRERIAGCNFKERVGECVEKNQRWLHGSNGNSGHSLKMFNWSFCLLFCLFLIV